MLRQENPGTRPSHLSLDRFVTGELSEPPILDEAARAHVNAVKAAAADVVPLDAHALRQRASQLTGNVDIPVSANRMPWMVGGLLAAALALFVTLQPPTADVIRTRGDADLLVFQVGRFALFPYDGEVVNPATDLVLKVRAGQHQGVVVLGVDGTGTVSQYWPESGEAPEALAGGGIVDLPGSLRLDATPGPEVLVAAFDMEVSPVRDALRTAFQVGGLEGVRGWASAHPDADAVVVERAR